MNNNRAIAASSDRRRASRPEIAALIVTLAPIVVAIVRAGARGWVPEYDAGYFTTRSLDVFTSHHPFVGAWSTIAAQLDENFNNLGPLQLITMAPFTRLEPYWGTAISVGLVNAAAVLTVWVSAGRLFTSRGRLGVMAATAAIEMSFGSLGLVDPRQQLALLLPFWAFLWLTVEMVCGDDRAVLPWIAFGSFVLQTHFSYAYIAMLLVIVGVAGYLLSNRGRWRERSLHRRIAWGFGLALALWVFPLWDQVSRSGNMGRVVSRAGGREPSGATVAAQVLADSPLSPPFWIPGSLDYFHPPWTYSPSTSWLILIVWAAALGALAYISIRRHNRTVAIMAVVGIGLLGGAHITAARIPTSTYGLLPQNYFWMWPISLFVACAMATEITRRFRSTAIHTGLLVVACAVIAIPSLPERQAFATWDVSSEITDVGGRPLLEEIATKLDSLRFDIGDAVVVEPSEQRLLIPDYYSILGVLVRQGIDVHFPSGSDDLSRFGGDRCENGTESWRLRVVVGTPRPETGDWDVVLAQRNGMRPAAAAELWILRSRVNSWLADGLFDIDPGRLDDAGVPGAEVKRILGVPGWPHADLWFYLPILVESRIARVPSGHAAEFERWLDLERSTLAVDLIVMISPNWLPENGCGS